MSAVIVPISPDPKRAQAIADSHHMILLADGRMVREYKYDADSVIYDAVAWMKDAMMRPEGAR